jgi:hypothetical protein
VLTRGALTSCARLRDVTLPRSQPQPSPPLPPSPTAGALGRLRDDAECSAVGNHLLAASVASLDSAHGAVLLHPWLQQHFPFLAYVSPLPPLP